MKNRFKNISLYFFIIVLTGAAPLFAIETAPRISDREIIEALIEIKIEQKALKELMNERFEQVDKRFEQVDKRFEQMFNLILSLFGSLMVLIIAVLGYSIWDRRTVTKKVSKRVDEIEEDLDIKDINGSKLIRLIKALKNLSKEDHRLAEVLRNFNLL